MEIGSFGIWSGLLRNGPVDDAVEAVRRIEALGFGAAWLPSGRPGQLERVKALTEGTTTLRLATGILNVYTEADPERTAETFWEIDQAHPGRLLLGIGIGHRESVGETTYGPPLKTMSAYLDGLDDANHPVPVDRRALAALRSGMLRLARDRSAGAHPYLTTPEHTRRAREILGPEALLAPEQGVVLEADAARARATARTHLTRYLKMTNYVANFREMGFTDADFENGGSDRFVDAIVAWGDVESVAQRILAHRDVGATHVTVQVLTETMDRAFPISDWEALSKALFD